MKSVFLYVAIVAVWGAVLVPMWLRRDAENTRPGFWLLGRRTVGGDGNTIEEQSIAGDESGEDENGALEPRDESRFGTGDEMRREPPAETVESAEAVETDAGRDLEYPDPRHRRPSPSRARSRGRGRGAVMARRRRRTLGFGCLLVASVVAVLTEVGRWWLILPPLGLLAGHLTLLRAAAQVDAERRDRLRATVRAARSRDRSSYVADVSEPPYVPEVGAEVIDLTEERSTREVYDQYVDAGLRAVGD